MAEYKFPLTPQCSQLPVSELQISVRRYLAMKLNPETSSCNHGNVPMNWMGLAELANFSYLQTQNFEREKSPFEALLVALGTRGACVGQLWDYINQLERYDIIEDVTLIQKLGVEVQRYEHRKQENMQVQDDHVTSPTSASEDEMMMVSEKLSGEKKKIHAFVSFCREDSEFVHGDLKRILENEMGYQLYIDERDLMPGADTFHITAEVIARRCQKVLLIMTPDYLKSDEFKFQHRIAMALSPGASKRFIIPILLKPVQIPLVLRFICIVDHTRDDLVQYFWIKLKAALMDNADGLPEAEMSKLRVLEKKGEVKEDENNPSPALNQNWFNQQQMNQYPGYAVNPHPAPMAHNQIPGFAANQYPRSYVVNENPRQIAANQYPGSYVVNQNPGPAVAYQIPATNQFPVFVADQDSLAHNVNYKTNYDVLPTEAFSNRIYPDLKAVDPNPMRQHTSRDVKPKIAKRTEQLCGQASDIKSADNSGGHRNMQMPSAPLLSEERLGFEVNAPNPNIKVEAGIDLDQRLRQARENTEESTIESGLNETLTIEDFHFAQTEEEDEERQEKHKQFAATLSGQ